MASSAQRDSPPEDLLPLESPSPDAGAPRQFSVGVLMILMTAFAVLFSIMKSLGAPPWLFAMIAVMFAGVTAAQVLLYKGRNPRKASSVMGTILLPLEILGVGVWVMFSPDVPAHERLVAFTPFIMAAVVFGPLIGPVFGYLAGVLVAGIFLVMDRLGARAAGSLWTLELEPFTAEDVDQLVNWLQSPSLLLHWADVSLAHPLGRAQIERRMKTAAAASPPRQLFKAVYAGGRQMAGYVELAGIDHESGCAQLERPLVAPGETDRVELSLALLRAVVAMAFGPMGLCRLETRVTERNSAMLEAFRRVGFVEQGSRFQKNARDTSSQPYCLLIKSKGHRKGGDRRVATDRRR